MLILAEDIFGLKDDHDTVRRPIPRSGGGAGASAYDLDGMNVALIRRLHDRGLPATQADLIAEI